MIALSMIPLPISSLIPGTFLYQIISATSAKTASREMMMDATEGSVSR